MLVQAMPYPAGGVGGVATPTTLSPRWKGSGLTLSNGNLTVASGGSVAFRACSTLDAKNAGKWYYEVTVDAIDTGGSAYTNLAVGVQHPNINLSPSGTYATGEVAYEDQYNSSNARICVAGQGGVGGGTVFETAWAPGDVISVAVDADARTVKFRKNGGSWSSDYSIGGTLPIMPMFRVVEQNSQMTANFGASAFTYSPPAGYENGWSVNDIYTGRYWRVLEREGNASYINIAEISMRLTSGGSNEIGSGTPTADSQYSGSYTPAKAVDGNTGTSWNSASGSNHWWQYDFGVGVTKAIKEIAITVASTGQYMRDGAFQYSDDGSTWWPGAYFTDYTWANGSTKTFAIADG